MRAILRCIRKIGNVLWHKGFEIHRYPLQEFSRNHRFLNALSFISMRFLPAIALSFVLAMPVILEAEEFDAVVRPENMIGPG